MATNITLKILIIVVELVILDYLEFVYIRWVDIVIKNIFCMNYKAVKERVLEVLRVNGLNVNRASKVLGIPQRTLNRQINEDGKVGMDLLYAIMDNFPAVSSVWLLMGKGEMMREDNADYNNDRSPYFEDRPLSAGLREMFEHEVETPSCFIAIPGHKADFYFPIRGDSMEPELYEGDIVGVVRVTDFESLSPEHTYMILTNEARFVKHCSTDPNNNEVIWCISPNYPSFTVNKGDVCALYRVVSRIQKL